MKKLAIILIFLVVAIKSFSQVQYLESSKLDSAVWKQINTYLASIGKTPMKHFEDSLSREYSYGVTRRNAELALIEHSDSVGYVTTAECIYQETRRGMNNGLQRMIDTKDYEGIAKLIVDSWIASETHRNLISIDNYAATTVTTVLKFDKSGGVAAVTASWHAIDYPKVWTTTSGYVFQP
jgi:hypothetical protein